MARSNRLESFSERVKKKSIPVICVTLICLGMISCFGNEAQKRRAKMPEIPVIQLSATDTFLEKSYVTNIQAIRNVEIRIKVGGYLEKTYVDEGQQVEKGQLLFSINTDEYEADVSKAKAILSNAISESKEAEIELNRVKLLVDKEVISATELEVAKAKQDAKLAKIEEARFSLQNTQTRLSFSHVRAPFKGIINRLPFKVGSLLNEGSLLTTISDISSVYAYFNVTENEYLNYLRNFTETGDNNNNKKVRLILADGSSFKDMGEIETTSSEFSQGTGSIAFRARFPNYNRILRHGATGEVILKTRLNDAILLPQKCAFEIQDKNYVYSIDSSNTVHVKSFQTKGRMAGFYIVHSGLQPGERIAYEGTQTLSDGIKIKPVNATFHTPGKE